MEKRKENKKNNNLGLKWDKTEKGMPTDGNDSFVWQRNDIHFCTAEELEEMGIIMPNPKAVN